MLVVYSLCFEYVFDVFVRCVEDMLLFFSCVCVCFHDMYCMCFKFVFRICTLEFILDKMTH